MITRLRLKKCSVKKCIYNMQAFPDMLYSSCRIPETLCFGVYNGCHIPMKLKGTASIILIVYLSICNHHYNDHLNQLEAPGLGLG